MEEEEEEEVVVKQLTSADELGGTARTRSESCFARSMEEKRGKNSEETVSGTVCALVQLYLLDRRLEERVHGGRNIDGAVEVHEVLRRRIRGRREDRRQKEGNKVAGAGGKSSPA
eukprot:529772-Hanusia_phi.AAC.1